NISYSNATLVYHLFLEFSRQFPASPSLPRLHEEMMAVAFRYGNYQQVIAWGEKYLARYPAGETALSVLHRMAEAYYLQKKFAQAWATYERLLQAAATQPTLKKFYLAYLESYLAKLVEQKEYLQVMAVYWEQIRQHPEDEKLYEHFLNFINAHNLYQEELKLYQVALRQFPGANWYHRLARWYLVRKGRAAFQEKTRELRQVMKEPELESYFKNFSDSWDGEDFPLEMARYAHEKFPTSPFFARFLFDLVFSRWGWGRRSDFQPQMLQVAAECFWLDETIRHRFYQYLSWKKKLPEEVRQAGALPGGTYLLFRAEGAAWLSHYELAYSLFTRLAGLYSGEEWIQKKTAELARSLGLRKEASALYLSLAERHPAEKEYWTRAGEVLAEAGQYEAASQCWEKLPKTGPYDPGSYLEVATLYWDYYQFEKALATIKKARLLFQDEFLMAREMGILYEGLKEYSPAVAEYVKTCLQQPGGNSTVIKRLVYLSRVRNLGPLIENTFRQWLTPERPGTVFAFGSYLAACGQTDAQKKLYAETFRQFREKAVLERFYRFFEEQGERQLMAEVLKHMVTAGGEDRASLSRLAAFYENQGDQVSAEAVYQKMLAHFKNEEEYLSVLLEVKNYYWRRKDVDKALSYLKEAVSRSSGPERERLSLELANQLMDARRLSEAGQVVRDLLKERPLETSLIDALARIYERENDWAQLRQLVAESIRQI
ncbi:MAG TPA: hypothetical protein PKW42_08370, partial [bacterium]|nr:hypothetical protein [bacterium]